jgi:hypothetical protein
MKKAQIAILWVMLGIAIGGMTVYLKMKKTEIQQIPASVIQTQWACRTTVQESYTWTQVIMIDKIAVSVPQTGWRGVVYNDAFGEGPNYACPRFTLTAYNQREVFGITFFATFTDQLGKTYNYQTDDYELYKSFKPRASWMLGLNQSGEVTNIHPTNQGESTTK